jgi:hypothetical protein
VPSHGQPAAEIADAGDEGGRVHVVCKGPEYSAQVFVDRADLVPVVTEFVVATPARTLDLEADGRQVGLSLAPGARVSVRQTKGDMIKIAYERWGLEGSGWLPKSKVDRFYRPADSDPRGPDDIDRELRVWPAATPLKVTPGGRTFATMRGPVSYVRLGESRDTHELIAVGFELDGQTYAVGWVSGRSAGGGAVGGIPASGSRKSEGNDARARLVRVPAETTLRSASGEMVGIVRHETEIICLADCDTGSPTVQIRCVTDFPARVDPQPASSNGDEG